MRFLKSILILVSISNALQAQLVLNPGSQRDFFGSFPVPAFNCSEWFTENPIVHDWRLARVRIFFGDNQLDAGESLRVDLFEDTIDQLLGLGAKTNVLIVGPQSKLELLFGSTWNDLEGAITVTMLSGSVAVTNVNLASKWSSGSGCASVAATNLNFSSPRLAIQKVDPMHQELSWATNYPGFVLEETDQISSGIWRRVTNSVGLHNGTNYGATVNYGPASRFFRLRER